jgi:hypothetical protein
LNGIQFKCKNLKGNRQEIAFRFKLTSVPDGFIDILPRSFAILLVIGGLVIIFTSPIGSTLQQWLGNAESLEEEIYHSALMISASLMTGLTVILLERPIVGNEGLFQKLNRKVNKRKNTEQNNDLTEYKFLSEVNFYGWLHENGCSLDQFNIQNSIINALLTGFTISGLLNLGWLLIVFPLGFLLSWLTFDLQLCLLTSAISLFGLLGLLLYNKKCWIPVKKKTIDELKEQYAKFLEKRNCHNS